MKLRIPLGLALGMLVAWCVTAAPDVKPTPIGKPTLDPENVAEFVHFSPSRPVFVRLYAFLDGKPYQRAWSEFMDHLFKTLDTNKDGVLSKAEFDRLISPGTLFNLNAFGGEAPAPFKDVDANGDGKVTLEELAAYFQKNPNAGPMRFQFTQDRRDEEAMYPGMRESSGGAEEMTRALIDLLDTNKDGKLSREELAAAPEVLRKLDTDDDEMVTYAEFKAGLRNLSRVRPNAAVPAPPAKKAYPQAAKERPAQPFVTVDPNSGATLAKQLLARYGPKDAKVLTRKDIGLDEAAFKQLDANGDGQLDLDELARFTRRAADLELTIRLGAGAMGEPRLVLADVAGKPPGLAGRTRRGQDSLVLSLDASQLDIETKAEGSGGRNNIEFLRQVYESQFDFADKEGKGYLEEKDAKQNVFNNSFKAMDLDGDGKLTRKEVLEYVDRLVSLQTRALKSQLSVHTAEASRGLFDLIDTNRDGRLSVRELRDAVKLLERLDRNGDGFLDPTEVPRTYQATLSQGPFGGSQFGGQFDPSQLFKSLPETTAGPLWFRKMDLNRDGDVSRREFIGTKEEFDRIDTDGDGLISAMEADRYDALKRQQKTSRKP
jgi:Ca2+-binding EF-hand superfamily protein